MNQKEIRELIDYLIDKDIAEFELERGDVKLRVKRGGVHTVGAAPVYTVAAPASAPPAGVHSAHAAAAAPPPFAATPAPAPAAAPVVEDEIAGAHIIKSPIVGTYYESPSPGAPPFIKPGDSVSVGQVLCIVEAMKLMNEIESDYSGRVVKIFVTNGQPVEYGQSLFAVKP
jgi:acetyl-CoA carboxylase biotin carboxyl carrier protein